MNLIIGRSRGQIRANEEELEIDKNTNREE